MKSGPSAAARSRVACRLALFTALAVGVAHAAPPPSAPEATADVTADQDHQQMMDQLGIQELRPGRSGDPKGPNPANYDETRANPYPNLPDPLRMADGRKVTSAKMWWDQRRPEIVRDYEREVYGTVPANAPKVEWRVVATEREQLGFGSLPVIARKMIGHVDNTAFPAIAVNIRMTVVTPADAKGPVPLLIMFSPAMLNPQGWPAPNQPSRDDYERINAAMKALLIKQDPALAEVFAAHPAYEPQLPPPFKPPEPNADGDPPNAQQLIAAGWGFATLDPASVQEDNGAGLRRGVIGLVNQGRPRKPDDWGALRAWAWGASRALDYLSADPAVDGRHIGIEGVSRYGKAALLTMAMDPRFAMVLVGSSGKGGATPLRRDFGEDVSNLATGEYHWMAGNFIKYDASKTRSGPMTPGQLPVDSDELIALCAPRLTFISYGAPEKGDAKWLDQQGSFMAAVAASPVFELLGAKGLERAPADYHTAAMPGINVARLGGDLAWRQHDGGHTDAPNMKYFIQWVDARIGHTPPAP
jgi:hypothetical protein